MAAALLFSASIASRDARAGVALAGGAFSLAIGLAACVRLFLAARNRVTPRPLPYAVHILCAAAIVVGYFVWAAVHRFVDIALHG